MEIKNMMDKLKEISKGELAVLLCSLIILFVFLFMPLFTAHERPNDSGKTGIDLLTDMRTSLKYDTSSIWLIPLVAGIGGLAALWGVFDVSARALSRVFAFLAGCVGFLYITYLYYGLFIVENSHDISHMPGFLILLLASVGLILQIFIPQRPVIPTKEKIMHLLPSAFWGLAAALLAVSTFLVYWHLHLDAPQYNMQGGLNIVVYFNRMESGDVDFDSLREINGLNHYIGMRHLEEAAEIERSIAPYAIVVFVVFLLVAAVWERKWMWLLTIPPLTFPFVFFGDLFFWLNNFGQNLDPTAAFSSSIQPFTPTPLGYGKIAQFETFATLQTGWIMATVASFLIAAGLVVRFVEYRKQHIAQVVQVEGA
jgi:copper chaperone NosL